MEKRYWLLKAQSRTGRFDLETFVPLVSPPIHASLSEGTGTFECRSLIRPHGPSRVGADWLFLSVHGRASASHVTSVCSDKGILHAYLM